MELVELHLPRKGAYVGLARLIVTSGARLAGLPEERLEDLKIAVGEAAAQALESQPRDEPLALAFGPRRGAFEVHVLSGARAGAARGADGGLRQWPSERGLGLTLVEGLADEVVFPDHSRSQMVLRFALEVAGSAPTVEDIAESLS